MPQERPWPKRRWVWIARCERSIYGADKCPSLPENGERTRRKECAPLWAGRTGENASDKKLSGYCFDYRRFVAAVESYPADSCSRQAVPTYFRSTDPFGSESTCSGRTSVPPDLCAAPIYRPAGRLYSRRCSKQFASALSHFGSSFEARLSVDWTPEYFAPVAPGIAAAQGCWAAAVVKARSPLVLALRVPPWLTVR